MLFGADFPSKSVVRKRLISSSLHNSIWMPLQNHWFCMQRHWFCMQKQRFCVLYLSPSTPLLLPSTPLHSPCTPSQQLNTPYKDKSGNSYKVYEKLYFLGRLWFDAETRYMTTTLIGQSRAFAIYDSRNYTVFIDQVIVLESSLHLRQQKLYCLYRQKRQEYLLRASTIVEIILSLQTQIKKTRTRYYLRQQKLYCLYRHIHNKEIPNIYDSRNYTVFIDPLTIIQRLSYLRQQKLYCLYRRKKKNGSKYIIYDSRNYTVFIDLSRLEVFIG